MAIELTPDVKAKLRASVVRYVAENLDQEIGGLQADMFLDFCLSEIGASIYNQAIADAQAYFQERVTDLEAVCHQKEFTYWAKADAEKYRRRK